MTVLLTRCTAPSKKIKNKIKEFYLPLVSQDVLNNSDHQAVLFLGNLVEGKYSFTLTVTDSKGQTNTDSGTLEVKPGTAVMDTCRKHKTGRSYESRTAE